MTLSAPPELIHCHIARGFDLARFGLVIDYRGDQPPLALFEALQAAGWETPAPAAPPAGAIDWSRPDAATGRRWSTKPFMVMGAMAVPGARTPASCATREWLHSTLARLDLHPEAEEIHVGVMRDIEPGLAEVLRDGAAGVTERDLARRAQMADVFAATPSIAEAAGRASRVGEQPTAPAPAAKAEPVVIDVREPSIDLSVPMTPAAAPAPVAAKVPAAPVAARRDESTVVAMSRFRGAARSSRKQPAVAPAAAGADDANAPLMWQPPVASAR